MKKFKFNLWKAQEDDDPVRESPGCLGIFIFLICLSLSLFSTSGNTNTIIESDADTTFISTLYDVDDNSQIWVIKSNVRPILDCGEFKHRDSVYAQHIRVMICDVDIINNKERINNNK